MSAASQPLDLARLVRAGELDQRTLLVLRLGETAHRFGCSTPRVEQVMDVVSRRLGLEGRFFAQPTSLFASFGPLGDQRTMLLRFEPGEVDLEKRWRMDATVAELLEGRLDIGAALAELEAIERAPARYGPTAVIVAHALVSASAARFFRGSWAEIAVAALCGVLVGLLAGLALRSTRTARLFEMLAAAAVSALAVAWSAWIGPIGTYTVTVAGLIVLLPGLTLTTAVNELALRHLAAGTARLTGSLLVFLELGFGVALGRQVARLGATVEASSQVPVASAWSLVLALALSPLCFAVVLRARPRDLGWIALSTTVAFAGARAGALSFGPELGAFLGAILVGLGANLYGRAFQRPSAVPMLPGILMLVPGSLGFQSLSSLIERDVLSGVGTAVTVAIVAVALVAGLFVASALVPPRSLDAPGA